MARIQHTHTLIKAKVRQGNKIWFMCSLPNCRYREQKAFLSGKNAMCSCGEIFILTATSLNRARPACPNCVQNNREKRRQEKEITVQSETNNIIYDLFSIETIQQEEQ